MKKKRTIALIFFSCLSIVLIGWYFFKRPRFEIIQPHLGDITESVYGLGKIRTNQKFDLIIGVVLKVRKNFVKEGDVVKKNQPLIQFDNLIVRSPISGTVTFLKYLEGETALPHLNILRVENLNDLYIELSLDQQSALRVRNGQVSKISFEYIRGNLIHGKVLTIFPKENEFIATIDVEEFPNNILPGMTADVSIEVGKIKNGMLVPLAAINNGYLNLKKDGKWINKKVHLGYVNTLFAQIIDPDILLTDQIRFKKRTE